MADQVTIKAEPAEAPAALDLSVHPVVSELRERVARIEERTENLLDHNPVAASAMEVATAARSTAEAALQKATELEKSAVAAVREEAEPIVEAEPPPAIQDPVETLDQPPVELHQERPQSFWSRFF